MAHGWLADVENVRLGQQPLQPPRNEVRRWSCLRPFETLHCRRLSRRKTMGDKFSTSKAEKAQIRLLIQDS